MKDLVNIWKKKYAITSTEEETEAVKIAKTKKGKKAAVINFLFSWTSIIFLTVITRVNQNWREMRMTTMGRGHQSIHMTT